MTDIDALKKEQDTDENLEKSFSTNPVKRAVQELFKHEFSGANYRKFAFEEAKALACNKLAEAMESKKGPHLSGGQNLIHKCKKTKNVEALLVALNEYLFS